MSHCGQTVLGISKEHIYCSFVFEKLSLNLLNTYGEHEYILLLQMFHNTFPIKNCIYFAVYFFNS